MAHSTEDPVWNEIRQLLETPIAQVDPDELALVLRYLPSFVSGYETGYRVVAQPNGVNIFLALPNDVLNAVVRTGLPLNLDFAQKWRAAMRGVHATACEKAELIINVHRDLKGLKNNTEA